MRIKGSACKNEFDDGQKTKLKIFRLKASGKEGGALHINNVNYLNEIKQTFTSPDNDGTELHEILSSLEFGEYIFLLVYEKDKRVGV